METINFLLGKFVLTDIYLTGMYSLEHAQNASTEPQSGIKIPRT